MKAKVKPNTIMFLKNQLKGQLGKLVDIKRGEKEPAYICWFFEKICLYLKELYLKKIH